MLEPIVPRYPKLLMLVWYQGFLKLPSQRCLAFPCARYRSGSKAAASQAERQRRSSKLRSCTRKYCVGLQRKARFSDSNVWGLTFRFTVPHQTDGVTWRSSSTRRAAGKTWSYVPPRECLRLREPSRNKVR